MKKLFLVLIMLLIGSFCFARTVTVRIDARQEAVTYISECIENTIKKYTENGYKFIDHINIEGNGYTRMIILVFEEVGK